MEREEFKRMLKEKGYPCEESEGRLIVGRTWNNIDLSWVKSIPSGVEFKNALGVYLASLRRIDPSVRFFNLSSVISPILGGSIEGSIIWSFSFSVPGIENYRVLNNMISMGLFWRS